MTETTILANDPEIRKEIKKIHDKFSNLLPLVANFYDNLSDVLDYAVNYLSKLPGFEILSRNDSSFNFCTDALKQYYSMNSQKMSTSNAYRISTNGPSDVGYFIMARVFPKQSGDPAFSGIIEKWAQRGEKIEGQFKNDLDAKLTEFRDRILYYESKLPVSAPVQP